MAEYVNTIQIPEVSRSTSASYEDPTSELKKQQGIDLGIDSPTLCYVDAGMLIIFPSSTTVQTKQDVLNCLLLIQLVADKQHNRNTDLDEWTQVFKQTMTNLLCWSDEGSSHGDLVVSDDHFTVSDLAMQEMTKDKTLSKDVDSFRKIFPVFDKLPDSDNAVKIFHQKTYDSASHDTTSMFCSFDEDSLILRLLLIGLSGVKDATTKPLSHPYLTKDVKSVKKMVTHQLLDKGIYGTIRDSVVMKLGDHIKTQISEIKLTE